MNNGKLWLPVRKDQLFHRDLKSHHFCLFPMLFFLIKETSKALGLEAVAAA